MKKLTNEQRGIALYMAKCVVGFVLITTIADAANLVDPRWFMDVTWVVISMLLVLSPDSKEVVPLTVVRVKSNMVASLISVVFLVLCREQVTLAICLSIIATIFACYMLDLMSGSRPALAAIVIILLHPLGTHLWSTAAERVMAVALGCVIGLLLTFVFHRQLPMRGNVTHASQSE